jgi:hypothetical protein
MPVGPPAASGAIMVTGCGTQPDAGAGAAQMSAEDIPTNARGTLVAHVLRIGCPRRIRLAAGTDAAAEGVSGSLRQIP